MVLVLFVMIGFGIKAFLEGDSLIEPNEVLLCIRPGEDGISLGCDIFISSKSIEI